MVSQITLLVVAVKVDHSVGGVQIDAQATSVGADEVGEVNVLLCVEQANVQLPWLRMMV